MSFRRPGERARGLCQLALLVFAVGAAGAAAAEQRIFRADLDDETTLIAGDPDGSGTAYFVIDDVSGEVSWEITYYDIEPLIQVHLHGPSDFPGSGFGPSGEGFVRMALVENENRLRQAVRQITRCLQQEKTDE